MQRAIIGALALLLLSSCGDSAGPGSGDPEKLIVDPLNLFVSQGSEQTALVRVVDGEGAAMDASVTLESVGPGISIASAPGYPAPEESDGKLIFQTSNGELALSVSGEELTRTSFRLASEGREAGVTVTVLPEGRVPVQFSGAEMPIGDTLVLAVSAPFRFRPDFELDPEFSGCAESVCFRTLELGSDGRSATILPLAPFSGVVRMQGMSLDYAGEVSLRSIPEDDEFNVSEWANPLPGTDDVATAPSIAMPLPGEVVSLFDAPPDEWSDGEYVKYYRLVSTRSADFGFELFDRGGSYGAYLLDEGTGEWILVGSDFSPGQRALFSGEHMLKIGRGPCCTTGYFRLDITAAPQSP